MKRVYIWGLCLVLFHCVLSADALALTSNAPIRTKQSLKVADAIARLGPGEYSIVAVRLQNTSVIKGYVSRVDADSFVVTDNESGAEHRVPYGVVARLQGMNLMNGKQASVGTGFRAGVLRVAGFLLPVHPRAVQNLTKGEKTLLVGIIVGVLLAIILAKVL